MNLMMLRRSLLYLLPASALLAAKPAPAPAQATSTDGHIILSPGGSIQAAYNSFPLYAGGTIFLKHGRYDVGAGLKLDRRKPLKLIADRPRSFETSTGSTAPQHGAILYSTSAQYLVDCLAPAAVVNAYGFTFEGLVFEIGNAQLGALYLPCANHVRLRDNLFWSKVDGKIAVKGERVPGLGDDVSWWRVENNLTTHIGLLWLDAVGQNSNQNVITGNVCFGNGTPCIRLVGNHRSVVRDNNIEGFPVGIELLGCRACRLDGNGGEKVDVFVDVISSYGCLISDMGISYPGARQFIRFTLGAMSNLVTASVGTGMGDLYNTAGWIEDQVGKNWILAPSSHGVPERINISGLRRGSGNPNGRVIASPGEMYQDKMGGTHWVKSVGSNANGWWQL